eukprot:scaffold31512_cov37-Tisochrysis_lutea.AAC.1
MTAGAGACRIPAGPCTCLIPRACSASVRAGARHSPAQMEAWHSLQPRVPAHLRSRGSIGSVRKNGLRTERVRAPHNASLCAGQCVSEAVISKVCKPGASRGRRRRATRRPRHLSRGLSCGWEEVRGLGGGVQQGPVSG